MNSSNAIPEPEYLQGLNPEQRQAVLHEHAHGPLLILAGAGSGKTAVLTRRIQHLVQSGIPPESILGLTFTTKAASEMRERLDITPAPELCTFHSLARKILLWNFQGRPLGSKLGLNAEFTLRESASKNDTDSDLRETLFYEACPKWKKAIETTPSQKQSRQEKRKVALKEGKLVYEDLIFLTEQLLQIPSAQAIIQNRFSHILIDEYQDINPSQYRLVRAILGTRSNLFAVGDDDQAIYAFRGSDIRNILQFRRDFPNARVLKLEKNYRSTPSIIQYSNRIFKKKAKEYRKILKPGSNRKDLLFRSNQSVQKWINPTGISEISRIRNTIRELRQQYDLKPEDFCILVRYNRQIEYYRSALHFTRSTVDSGEEIQIQTLHASKGLQYPVVFYCGLAEGLSPARCDEENPEKRQIHFEEERRLFYVGVTRAECILILSFCREGVWRGKYQSFKISPFFRI